MKKISLFAVFLLLALPISTYALSFTFGPVSDEGGTGTATMDIEILGTDLTTIIENTSPVDLDDGSEDGGNSPGITGFGFDLYPVNLVLISWELSAFTNADNELPSAPLGSSTIPGDWVMGDFLSGITLDYLPNNSGNADGALFNPEAFEDPNNTLPSGSNAVYYTTATLTMMFDVVPILNTDSEWSPSVRMQNVGTGGEGSLKVSIPDASIMFLLGLPLLLLGLYGRRKSLN
jgi:hypothetical protein